MCARLHTYVYEAQSLLNIRDRINASKQSNILRIARNAISSEDNGGSRGESVGRDAKDEFRKSEPVQKDTRIIRRKGDDKGNV